MKNKILKNIKSILFCSFVLSFLLLLQPLSFAQDNKGTAGLVFLKVPMNARQMGMAEAFSGLSDDMSAMRYNVAGLGVLKFPEFSTTYLNWIEDSYASAILMGYSTVSDTTKGLHGGGTLGLGITYFNEGTGDEYVSSDPSNWGSPVGFKASDWALQLGYAFPYIFSRYTSLSFGVGFKFSRQSLWGVSGSAFSGDAGMLFTSKYLSLGFSAENLGGKVRLYEQDDKLPLTIRGGTALTIWEGNRYKGVKKWTNITLTADLSKPADRDISYRFGGEFSIPGIDDIFGASARIGYIIGQDYDKLGMSYGAGLSIPIYPISTRLDADYAFTPLKEIASNELSHRLTFTFRFGGAGSGLEGRAKGMFPPEILPEDIPPITEPPAKSKGGLEDIYGIAKEKESGKLKVALLDTVGLLITMRINFEFDKADIREDDFPTLIDVAEILNMAPNSMIAIEGHTDAIGSKIYNLKLSQLRVNSVRDFLIKHNVSRDRFYPPVGLGESEPIASNATPEGRFLNRRVNIILFANKRDIEFLPGTAVLETKADFNKVTIICNGTPANITHSLLDNPYRIVVDVQNMLTLTDEMQLKVEKGKIQRVRIGYHEKDEDSFYTRVVLDLTSKPADYNVTTVGNKIIIEVK